MQVNSSSNSYTNAQHQKYLFDRLKQYHNHRGSDAVIDGFVHLKNALVLIKKDCQLHPRKGICSLIRLHISMNPGRVVHVGDPIMNILKLSYESWPKWSGSWFYPVPSIDQSSPDQAFCGAELYGTMYKGEYGSLRLELVDHMIEWISQNNKDIIDALECACVPSLEVSDKCIEL